MHTETTTQTDSAVRAAHTPGHYEAGKAYKGTGGDFYAIVFAPEKTGTPHAPRVAEVYGLTREECEANTALISASPDLGEALLGALSIIESEPETCGIYKAHTDKIRAALVKAGLL